MYTKLNLLFTRVGHNSMLTHAYAVDLYRKEFKRHQKGVIGIALVRFFYIATDIWN